MKEGHQRDPERIRGFNTRLGRLEGVLARAVHVAATLRIAREPQPDGPSSRFGGLVRRPGRDVQVRPAELNQPVSAPPEARHWLTGLSRFYATLARTPAEKVPDKELLLAQLDRTVDRLTMQVAGAVGESVEPIADVASRATGRANLSGGVVEDIENRLRTRVDEALGEAVPVPSSPGHGVFTGLVENRVGGSLQDRTLVDAGSALSASTQLGPLAYDPARPLEIVTDVDLPSSELAVNPATAASGFILTPLDLEVIDGPTQRGEIARFDPGLISGAVGEAVTTIEIIDHPVADPAGDSDVVDATIIDDIVSPATPADAGPAPFADEPSPPPAPPRLPGPSAPAGPGEW